MASKNPMYDHLKHACDMSGGSMKIVVAVYSKAEEDLAKSTLKGMRNSSKISIRTFSNIPRGVVPHSAGGIPGSENEVQPPSVEDFV